MLDWLKRNPRITTVALVVLGLAILIVGIIFAVKEVNKGEEEPTLTTPVIPSSPSSPSSPTPPVLRQKYNIISPYDYSSDSPGGTNVIQEEREFMVDECEELADSNEDAIGFSWNIYSWWEDNNNRENPSELSACLVREATETLCMDEDGNADCTNLSGINMTQFLFEKDDEQGIDINEWNIHLGVDSEECAIQIGEGKSGTGNEDIDMLTNITSAEECCNECTGNSECKSFVYRSVDQECWLKDEVFDRADDSRPGYVFGKPKPSESSLTISLKECEDLVKNENDYESFVYDFENGKCFPTTDIKPILPWRGPPEVDPQYFPGALFIPKQLDYQLVTTEGTTCEDLDMNFIMNSSDCLNAAEVLHLGNLPMGGTGWENNTEGPDSLTERPKGCYWKTAGRGDPIDQSLWLGNTDEDTGGSQIWPEINSNGSRLQICQKR